MASRKTNLGPFRTKTVLLVEDEPAIRAFVRLCLEGFGYAVLDAGDPRDAIAIARNHAAGIDLVLTDIVLPEMSGRDLVDRLSAIRPSIRALYMSGYGVEEIAHHGMMEPGIKMLSKPFTREALARKVREVLEAPDITEVRR
ncbi:MAG TPA: response regulator [Candidatus Eisenbacteria bacterium]|nr:response regulator [Candidatus Eisenbacteria bacterium]